MKGRNRGCKKETEEKEVDGTFSCDLRSIVGRKETELGIDFRTRKQVAVFLRNTSSVLRLTLFSRGKIQQEWRDLRLKRRYKVAQYTKAYRI